MPWLPELQVTTEDPTLGPAGLDALRKTSLSDVHYGMRVCIGGTSDDWYKEAAGGVAYIGSIAFTDDTPTFVFMSNMPDAMWEAISHEVGPGALAAAWKVAGASLALLAAALPGSSRRTAGPAWRAQARR